MSIQIRGQRKASCRQRIPGSSCAWKETVDIGILITTRNDDRKITHQNNEWTTQGNMELSSDEHLPK